MAFNPDIVVTASCVVNRRGENERVLFCNLSSGDVRWHKGRVFISEVFRFEVLGFEQVEEDFYKVYFRDVEIGEFDRKRFASVMR